MCSQSFQPFVKQVETYVFREFARLPGLCNFVAPQYAQTNLKQAQCIKAWSTLSAPVTPVVFPSLEVFQAFYAKSSFQHLLYVSVIIHYESLYICMKLVQGISHICS